MKFRDKQRRAIMLQFNDEGHLEAIYKGKVIGTFEFYQDQDIRGSRLELIDMNVDENFRLAGIGVAMMRFAVKRLVYFILPRPGRDVDAPNFLTIDGAALVNHCFRKGILSERFERQYKD